MTSLEIQRRYFRYYLGVLNQADILYCEGGEALAQGLELLDEAWSKICHGQEQAARLMERDKEAAWCCDRYAGYGASVLHVRQHPSDQIRWLESAVNAARALEDRVAEAIHLGNLGIALYLLGDSRRAIECHELNLTIAREIGDRRIEGAALANLGSCLRFTGRVPKGYQPL
jgi:tetratricopeptide (TPR) repeat protein